MFLLKILKYETVIASFFLLKIVLFNYFQVLISLWKSDYITLYERRPSLVIVNIAHLTITEICTKGTELNLKFQYLEAEAGRSLEFQGYTRETLS